MSLRLCLSFLAASLAAFPILAAQSKAEPAQRISAPVLHENIAVYFVHGASAPGPVPQTLQEALAKGTVVVTETGNVQKLQIENSGDEPVFVQFGDIIKGGRQDRVLVSSIILQPKSGPVPISAYCVEQGRWSARGIEDAKKFSLSEALMPSREAKVAMAMPPADRTAVLSTPDTTPSAASPPRNERIQRQGPVRGDSQSEVWRSVGLVQERLTANLAAPVASEKSKTSLQLALEHETLKTAQQAYLSALEPAGQKGDDIVGVVFAVNGRISGADVYPSTGLFQKMWPKLVRAAATEALTAKGAAATEQPPTPDTVMAFLAEADAGTKSARDIGVLAKLETRDAAKSVTMEARTASGAFIHRNYLAK
jgi:hypothetical protein